MIDQDTFGWGWYRGGQLAADYAGYVYTQFSTTKKLYMGVRFRADTGEWHYGWVSLLRSSTGRQIELEAFGWAYETEPGKPIIAGAVPGPGTLALLAFGAAIRLGRERR